MRKGFPVCACFKGRVRHLMLVQCAPPIPGKSAALGAGNQCAPPILQGLPKGSILFGSRQGVCSLEPEADRTPTPPRAHFDAPLADASSEQSNPVGHAPSHCDREQAKPPVPMPPPPSTPSISPSPIAMNLCHGAKYRTRIWHNCPQLSVTTTPKGQRWTAWRTKAR